MKVFFFLFFLFFFLYGLSLYFLGMVDYWTPVGLSWKTKKKKKKKKKKKDTTLRTDRKRLSVILPRERPSRFKGRALRNRAYERVPVQFRDNIQMLSAATISFGWFSRCLMVQMFNGPGIFLALLGRSIERAERYEKLGVLPTFWSTCLYRVGWPPIIGPSVVWTGGILSRFVPLFILGWKEGNMPATIHFHR